MYIYTYAYQHIYVYILHVSLFLRCTIVNVLQKGEMGTNPLNYSGSVQRVCKIVSERLVNIDLSKMDERTICICYLSSLSNILLLLHTCIDDQIV